METLFDRTETFYLQVRIPNFMFAVLIHVGQTPNVCGGRCPVYSNGTFKFVPIFVEPPRPYPDPTYVDLGLSDFVPPGLRNKPAFRSPEFETLTYSHVTRPGESDVYEKLRNEGGFLVFFSTLHYIDKRPPAVEGISRDHGAYIIGYFKVEGVYRDSEVATDLKLQARFKANGDFGREKATGERVSDWWISGSEGGLFPKAIPLTESSEPSKWNVFTQTNLCTTTGKSLANYSKAKYNWTLICPSKNLASLRNWIHMFTGVQI